MIPYLIQLDYIVPDGDDQTMESSSTIWNYPTGDREKAVDLLLELFNCIQSDASCHIGEVKEIYGITIYNATGDFDPHNPSMDRMLPSKVRVRDERILMLVQLMFAAAKAVSDQALVLDEAGVVIETTERALRRFLDPIVDTIDSCISDTI